MIRYPMLLLLALAAAGGARAADDKPCEQRVLQQHKVVVCTVDMARDTLRTLWKNKTGAPYGSLSGIGAAATPETGPMLFAMNAGMYHANLDPVGLYIEKGVTEKKAVTGGGPGNFHMRPNGVFAVTGNRAEVTETRRFVASKAKPEFASQSGPMLVIDGRLHPGFTGHSTSKKIRNGVGVARDGRKVWFVISDEPVTFFEFARMFRDDLGARNALYFDGSISSLYAPSVNRADWFMPVGPIVAAFRR